MIQIVLCLGEAPRQGEGGTWLYDRGEGLWCLGGAQQLASISKRGDISWILKKIFIWLHQVLVSIFDLSCGMWDLVP